MSLAAASVKRSCVVNVVKCLSSGGKVSGCSTRTAAAVSSSSYESVGATAGSESVESVNATSSFDFEPFSSILSEQAGFPT